ncbi:hypothetical protein Acr_00g0061360 [Actinidia rufa]|uniref:Uncharacterized protein n=1 Tax=Actinidia rufa TaxID=165716 RepID=A0A7J0DNW5_9ERIC|nr:hypothetical protein Acr_00g0061360 [Actinidia rufa]
MARLLTPTVAPLVAYRSTARPVEGHRAKRKPFEVKSTLIGVELSLVKSVSKQISHSHSPRRRLTVGSAFPTKSGEFPTRLGVFATSFRERSADSRFSGRFAITLQDSCN